MYMKVFYIYTSVPLCTGIVCAGIACMSGISLCTGIACISRFCMYEQVCRYVHELHVREGIACMWGMSLCAGIATTTQ
jgi:hypothetical protein